ncbi:GntR family transcriptional regulator [Planotetraspora kaengkrachanensis]|uniref:GntR family transcriptional regulator n=1 Tax=Planotetraspora kaengkrachanensis TaxID=575193 RepID=A0A8J3PZ72_9ACTN|nr:GntR family transcriptional regulator [Planotetraspora kaengkrachanensis]GIG83839.1 GntR family transcriptional regulator [Planotetraspora kaengkrachanensis]
MSGTAEPPYQRIVADIRRRIEDGRLAPGDRVPSTRQIAGEWGVALATATKALTTLRQEGLVQARPRVGTVVAEPGAGTDSLAAHVERRRRSRPAQAAEQELTRERIVRAAIEIADAEGLNALSMRGVAARLGVATMSTYRHVAGKDDLVVLMADAAFGDYSYEQPRPTGWRARMESTARALWTLYRRHPWLAQVDTLTRPMPLPNLLVHGEQILTALEEQGFDPTATLDLQVLLYSHVQGLAVHLEREAQAQAATGLSEDEWMELHGPAMGSIAASGRYPAFARLMGAFAEGGYDLDLDHIFELGLRTLLDGFARLFEERRQPGVRRGR